MTPQEQAVYKSLKYLAKNYPSWVSQDELTHMFTSKYLIKLDDEYFNEYSGDKKILIDFNTKTTYWHVRRYNYDIREHNEKTRNIEWNSCIAKFYPLLQQNCISNIEYKILQAEQKRTEKVRMLQANCIFRREMATIAELE